MKRYVVCILVFYLSSSLGMINQSAFQTLLKYQNDCATETGATDYSIELARHNRKIYDDGQLDGFAVCMIKKFNIMNNDGTINQDSYTYVLISDNPKQFETADKCKVLTGRDVYESARKIMTCFLNTDIYVLDPTPKPIS